jgi:hypothetical protein
MFGRRAAAALFLSLLAFGPGLAVAAPAKVDVKTKWYTIAVQPTSSSGTLFLTNEVNGPVFEPYRSGDVTQMWTTVQDFYPNSAPVTSDSGIDFGDIVGGVTGMLDCLAHWPPECGFNVSIQIPPVKIVNRAGVGCLILNSSKALMTTCLSSGNGMKQQRWFISPDRSGEAKLSTNTGCLTTAKGRDPKLLAPFGASCTKTPPGSQQLFVLQLAADLQCKTGYWQICFVDGQN